VNSQLAAVLEAVLMRPIPDAKNLGYPWYSVAKMAPGVPFHLSIPVEGAWPRHFRSAHSGLLSAGMAKSDEKTRFVVPPFAGLTVPDSKRMASGSPWRLFKV